MPDEPLFSLRRLYNAWRHYVSVPVTDSRVKPGVIVPWYGIASSIEEVHAVGEMQTYIAIRCNGKRYATTFENTEKLYIKREEGGEQP